MNNYDRIKSTQIEDYIFIIYYVLITLSLYSNKIEREYLITNNHEKKEEYRILLFIIFGIAFLVYLYYFISSFDDLKKCNNHHSYKLNELSALASFLVLVSGSLYLYIIFSDNDLSVELAFN